MGSITWGREVAEAYDATYSAMFDASIVDPTVESSPSWRDTAPPWSSPWARDGWHCR